MRLIKIKVKHCINRIYFYFFNKKNKSRIHSCSADPKAQYGHHVGIAENTIVNYDVCIGKYSYVNTNSSVENCEIGNYCSISSGVWINPIEHNLTKRSTSPFIEPPIQKRPKVTIGNDVLISLNAIVLEGVSIGNGAVIAAGAVVTKDVKPYEIVGGVPAKHIGWRFEQSEIDLISATKWWEKDLEDLAANMLFLRNESDNWIEE